MPAPYPKEFRDDVVRVAQNREPGTQLNQIAKDFGVSDMRTTLQDVDFSIRQLVDIGLRALSPAVNDPTTAVEVILRLGV